MKNFCKLPKLSPGDQVAIISPSSGLAGTYPWVQDLGLQRLQDKFNLVPKEYPTTRQMGSSLADRARDIMLAFRDTKNKAVFASIGGDDQIKLIKLLDKQIFIDNPKPFFGYSDNTHLHNFLWNLGIPSYYGASIMTELAFHNCIPELNIKYIEQALFKRGEILVDVSSSYNDIGLEWANKDDLNKQRIFEPNEGLYWDGNDVGKGVLWGGCVESLIVQCTSQKYLPSDLDINGAILFIETAEDIPEHWIIEYLLTGFGERGWLYLVKGVLVGRPKTWEFNKQLSLDQKSEYKKQQRQTVIKTIRDYNKDIPIVQNVDFGHTAPQIVIPYGGMAKIDPTNKKIYLSY